MSREHICVDCRVEAVAEPSLKRAVRPTNIDVHPRAPRCATHARALRKAQKARAREGAAIRRYGVTSADLEAYRASCGSLCAGCGPRTGRRGRNIDHDHATGEWRGLLCTACNRFIGMIGDDPNVLDCLAAYLRTPPARAVTGVRERAGSRGSG